MHAATGQQKEEEIATQEAVLGKTLVQTVPERGWGTECGPAGQQMFLLLWDPGLAARLMAK